jgi:ketosteroid isomerase-like protein
MTAVDDVDELIERYQLALDEFMKGNPKPVQELFSHREDASLANPYGPPVRGWDGIAKTTEHAASLRRDGRATGFEVVAKYVTAELAYVVQIEHLESKVGERNEISPYSLRATMIFRPEDGTWKVVHRHADPITGPRPAGSVIQEE